MVKTGMLPSAEVRIALELLNVSCSLAAPKLEELSCIAEPCAVSMLLPACAVSATALIETAHVVCPCQCPS